MLNTIRSILNRPFPENQGPFGSLRMTVYVSIFITLFLLVFQPFGIVDLEDNKFWVCLGFGSMTFVGALLFESLVRVITRLFGGTGRWTLGKWLLNNLGILCFVSLANFLFARLYIFGYIDWQLFPAMLYSTFAVGILPLTILGGFLLLTQERKFQRIAGSINAQPKAPVPVDSKQQLFNLPLAHIRYVEALQNYVKIHWVDAEGQTRELVERATLKQIRETTRGGPLVPCHRSYLVNRAHVLRAEGNAQGLLLTLAGYAQPVPVSRRYVPAFRAK